jgi:hypothetical protein
MCTRATVIACHLAALEPAEQRRRADLAEAVSRQAVAIVDTADGYALRLDDLDLLPHAIEWISLERRCCPFLRFELTFEPDTGPVWLRLGGGAGVKEFLAAAFQRDSA